MRLSSVAFVDKMSTNATATPRQLVQVFAIIQVHKPCRFVDKRDDLVDNVDKSQNPLGVTCLKTSDAPHLVTLSDSFLVTGMQL